MASLGHVAVGLLAGRMFAPHVPWLPLRFRSGNSAAAQAGENPGVAYGSVTAGDQRDKMGRLGVMAFFSALALLPDLDYLTVMMGMPDAGPTGHRGATHSLLPALVATWMAAVLAPRLRLPRWRTSILCGVVVASHALLDAMTVTSRGVPLLWPLSFDRFEMPWRPIPNAPCGLAYLSREGMRVASVELIQFLPILLISFWPRSRDGLSEGASGAHRERAPSRRAPITQHVS